MTKVIKRNSETLELEAYIKRSGARNIKSPAFARFSKGRAGEGWGVSNTAVLSDTSGNSGRKSTG
jgi:hypothetical protein